MLRNVSRSGKRTELTFTQSSSILAQPWNPIADPLIHHQIMHSIISSEVAHCHLPKSRRTTRPLSQSILERQRNRWVHIATSQLLGNVKERFSRRKRGPFHHSYHWVLFAWTTPNTTVVILEQAWDVWLLMRLTSLSLTIVASEIAGGTRVWRDKLRMRHGVRTSWFLSLLDEVDISLILHVVDADTFFSLVLESTFNDLLDL